MKITKKVQKNIMKKVYSVVKERRAVISLTAAYGWLMDRSE